MADILAKAALAFGDEEYDEALELYSQVINERGKTAELLAARSQTYTAMEKYVEALEDANKAIELDPNSSQGYLRKGISLFQLEEYEAARTAFSKGHDIEPSNKKLRTWLGKCDAELQSTHGQQVNGSASQTDELAQSAAVEPTPSATPVPASTPSATVPTASEETGVPLAPSAPPAVIAKYRHQWLQTLPFVEINIYAKNLSQDRVKVEYTDHSVHVTINDAEGHSEYAFAAEELFGKILPESCKHTITPSKLEVKLKKTDNLQWESLEKVGAASTSARVTPVAEPIANPAPYPWSTRKHQVDWDKVEADVKAAEKDEKLEGEAALQQLFSQIYSGADEDTRRAMNKSFVESNGTVLSTNWKEVGTKAVECQAPSNAEVKKL